jgi:hypothetical protein
MVIEKIQSPFNIPPPWNGNKKNSIAQEVKWGMNLMNITYQDDEATLVFPKADV